LRRPVESAAQNGHGSDLSAALIITTIDMTRTQPLSSLMNSNFPLINLEVCRAPFLTRSLVGKC
jgi:hypothetical protein